jgi:2-(1,2-epoxy-1,2-dihydrophenyl)acetyl-CoA isomerase
MNLVRYSREGGVGWIVLNRPERLNTMTREFLEDSLVVFRSAVEDEAASVLVLTGAGRGFCAGGDLAAMSDEGGFGTGTPELESQRLRRYMETSRLLHETPKVTVAAINGACAGAGLSWACAMDLRFAADNARFNTAFLNAGLSGDFGGSWLLPRIIGAGRAREKYLLPGPFDAAEALRIGLVSGVFPSDELISEVTRIAQRLARSAPIARQLIKQNLLDQEEISFARALDLEAARHGYCCTTKDFHEAAAAYVARREPVFYGS